MSPTPGTPSGTLGSGAEQPDTYERSLAHWAEQGRAGMEAFYALASEDYRQMVAARNWSADLRRVARDSRVRALDVACGSGKFPAELMRRGLADALAGTTVEVDLLDPSAFSIAEARSVLGPPFVPAAEHEVRLQDLDPSHGDYDVAWATHALYAIPPSELDAGVARMVAALRPGGFGAVVQATTTSHYLRFAELFRAAHSPAGTPFTSAEQVAASLVAAGVTPSVGTLRYTVGSTDRDVVEGFLQRCVFDDSVPLSRMEADGPLGEYLAGCRGPEGYRFVQDVHVLTWDV
ncbi:bifunctional 2-polyprenyl-6-hydroxyphenol methylase/3-demethylubiquinol 3-O-methyltransferase UbiG [Pseudonocardia sp. KRD291]|uniref:class I SAM-dependent methyltransferase n=1 Tax=Pseudonocardia sp. KRD291 TaxID=2792007 RepID=UPI001C49DEBB|nr:class I SAM-dependent methyltransferase [Pseudonocardia sp. KRD291]MBW0102222.1 class I SAM-dependent methyltransferase [Pseudonocardia sp. KRD291]